LRSPPSLELQNHKEFDKELVELVETRSLGSLESLWSLGHEISRGALALKVSVSKTSKSFLLPKLGQRAIAHCPGFFSL